MLLVFTISLDMGSLEEMFPYLMKPAFDIIGYINSFSVCGKYKLCLALIHVWLLSTKSKKIENTLSIIF